MMKLVSIILPVFNAAPYLNECLDSIQQQGYHNWELIAVDDCSTDASLQILEERAASDPRINVYSNENKGLVNALVAGEGEASGECITRMDADDLMCEGRLSIMVESIGDKEGVVAVGLVKYFRTDQALGKGYLKYEKWLNSLTRSSSNFSQIYKECTIPSPCWMMLTKDFRRIGGFSGGYPEDYDLAFRMRSHQVRVQGINEVLLKWRDHGSRASRTDSNYADNRFLNLKMKYFISHESTKNLGLWGAGKKGKKIASLLIQNSIEFNWYTNNPNKIGREIYSIELQSSENNTSESVIIAVANEEEQLEIKGYLEQINPVPKYYFFC